MFKRCEERGQGEYDEILSLFFPTMILEKKTCLLLLAFVMLLFASFV